MRILGVLQRLAVVYGVLATIEVLCTRSRQYSLTANLNNAKHASTITTATVKTARTKRVTAVFRDLTNFPLQWLSIIGLITIWALVIYLVPFNDCPAGYLGPGKYRQSTELGVRDSTVDARLNCRQNMIILFRCDDF